ncbi:LINE-1 retrotransposable element ORF2 protein [Folsomia candida]|uniref:LINE-1 retrotransposable element ORF2 protein n=1 Tax=Folsomia candida TaxID=158441 RepID=A0A226DPF2_FOLCA|nr:LINE-1 retrotransposable element ORF2 protein [Folsomia candida]
MAPSALDKAESDRESVSDTLDYVELELTDHATTPLGERSVINQINILKTAQIDIMETHKKIISISPPDMKPHQVEYMRLLRKTDRLLSAFTGIRMSFPNSSTSIPIPIPGTPVQPSSVDIRLPRLELPTFDGTLNDWSQVRGEASRQISSMIITDGNYDIAWNSLHDRYQNDREILFAILRRFMNQPVVQQQSSSSIRQLVDVSQESIRSLDVLKLPTDQWDALLLFIILSKMDSTSKELWEQSLKDSSIPKLKSLFDFLEQRARALAASGTEATPSKTYNKKSGNGNNQSNHRPLVHHTNSPSHSSSPCKACNNESHYLYKCEVFLSWSPQQRIDFVRRNGLCYNCLKDNHRVTECNNKFGCKTCSSKHHTLLHKPVANRPVNPQPQQHNPTAASVPAPARVNFTSIPQPVANEFDTLLATALVQVADRHGQYHTFRVLADNGSNTNYITDSCIKRIGAPLRRCHWVGRSIRRERHRNHAVHCECLVTSKITEKLPTSYFDHTKWSHLQGLQLADPLYYKPLDVDMLLGAEFFFAILECGKISGPPNSPVAIKTSFGWLIGGGSSDIPLIQPRVNATLAQSLSSTTTTIGCDPTDENLDATLRKFWEMDSEPSHRLPTQEETTIESHFKSTYTRDHAGRFTVQLPFKSPRPKLGSSLNIAMKRLLLLERRLHSNPDARKQYVDFMKEYESLGHMQEVHPMDSDPSLVCYVPHHFILKESSSTTKFRVVFDASAKTSSGVSLNDGLMVGPNIQDSLVDILSRFRLHKIAFTADIKKMYRQIRVTPEDSNLQRILWRDDPPKPVKHYNLQTVTYGTASAPYLATRVLEETAVVSQQQLPRAAEVAGRDFYVDDLISGEPTVPEAFQTQQELLSLTKDAGFELCKWSYNSQDVFPTPTTHHSQGSSEAIAEEKQATSLHTIVKTDQLLLDRYSSFPKLLRVTAYVFRFIKNLKGHKYTPSPLFTGGLRAISDTTNLSPLIAPTEVTYSPLSPGEINCAKLYWIRLVQQQEFPREIHALQAGQPVNSKSKIVSFCPFLDSDGVLKVGGRLNHSDLPASQKHPILLTSHNPITHLLINHEHIINFHAGPQLLMSTLQRQYWILRLKDAVRRQIGKCVTCTKLRAKTMQQLMGNLPSFRVIPARAFLKTGIDYAGPFLPRPIQSRSKTTIKAYLAVFVCCTTRALHLEVVSSLSTDAFLAALRRFISRRGRPTDLYSDCGTNFVGANHEMKDFLKLVMSRPHNQAISDHLSKDGIDWHFNPPASPHFGGLWEAGGKSVKFHLRRVMGTQRLTFEEMTTITSQIESILNSRPLTPESNNPDDYNALTPGHFLIGAPLNSIPEPTLEDIKISRLSRWQLLQQMVESFWKRWSNEYLTRLQQRPKWMSKSPNISIGAMVVIKDETQPPLKWKLGRIESLHPGPDAIVRVVTVRTSTGIFKLHSNAYHPVNSYLIFVENKSYEGSGEDVFESDTDGSFSQDKSSSQPRTKRVRAKASKPQKIRQEIFITTKFPQDLEVMLEEREVTAAPSCDGIYMLGDWNFVVDSNRDRFGNIENRKGLAKQFQNFIQSNGFFDTYRHLRPQGKDVTFVCRMNAAIRGDGVCSDFPDRKITTVHNGITVSEALCDLPSDQRLKLVWNFFREKFSSPLINLSGLDLFMAQMPKINFPEFLDNDLSENEILESITKSPNNKAPGLDGLPYEFYKVFSLQFSKILSLVAKLSCEEGKFPKSCRSSVATLIFKANDPKDLKNYRTISLTNSDYKIISSAIKSRINTTLPSVIGPWQTCGVKGRSIFDNLSFIRDAFQSCELEGLLFSLDQEAAYDRVSHEYLYRVLHNFGYPKKIINYIRLLHTEFSLVISVGSDLTSPISFRVGLTQGDPIASSLYCLAIEPFLFNLDNKLRDSGPSAWRRHPNIYLSAYADDTNALLGNQNQISIVVSEYTKFSAFSSSKLNSNKSNILILGAYNLQIPVEFPVVSDGLKILGIYFGHERYMAQNFLTMMTKFDSKLEFYTTKCAPVSHFSRAKIVNTFLLPIFWYVLKVLDPPESFLGLICSKIENYVWATSKRWVARPYVYLPILNGGLGVRSPAAQIATFRLTFVQKIMAQNNNTYFLTESELQTSKFINGDMNLSPFFTNIQTMTQLLGLRLTSCSKDILNEIHIHSKIVFHDLSNNYISRCKVIKIKDLFAEQFLTNLDSLPRATHRHVLAERAKHVNVVAMVTESTNTQLALFSLYDKSILVSVVKETNYLHCLRSHVGIKWEELDNNFCSLPQWEHLVTTPISNPEKDTVFKIWHNVGLTPLLAQSLHIYDNHCCPFCASVHPKVIHYLSCSYVTDLRQVVANLLTKVNICTQAFDEAFRHGTKHVGGGGTPNCAPEHTLVEHQVCEDAAQKLKSVCSTTVCSGAQLGVPPPPM